MPKAPRKRGASIEVSAAMGGGNAKIKKKIRDIERLLRKDTLGADIRLENERALKALRVELEEAQSRLKERKTAKKYHMVRFFEKKKALRKLKQATKEVKRLEEEGDKKAIKKARRVLKHAQIDTAYVLLFPKSQKYLSLYPTDHETNSEAHLTAKAKKGIQETEEARRNRRKEMEKLIDEDQLPFTFEDVLAGKEVVTTLAPAATPLAEIDAAEDNADDDDDFFE